MPPPSRSDRPAHRPDIEGLRAVAHRRRAALPTPGSPSLAGGFAGVDVFFVISGFLITELLVRELDRTGPSRCARFYARRVRRLLPPALIVLVAGRVASSRAAVAARRRGRRRRRRSRPALYAINWRFAAQAVDYFAAGAADRAAAALLVARGRGAVLPRAGRCCCSASRWCSRRRAAGSRRADRGRSRAIASGSFAALSIAPTAQPEPGRTSALPARAWELGARRRCWPSAADRLARLPAGAAAAAWAGLAAIVAATLVLDEATPFPGVAGAAAGARRRRAARRPGVRAARRPDARC